MVNDDVIDSMLDVAMVIDTAQHATAERKTDPSFLETSAAVRHYRRDRIEKTEDSVMQIQYLDELDAKLAGIKGEAERAIVEARRLIADLRNRLATGLPA